MPRIHWTFPERLMAAIEAEAGRRMRNDIKTGQTLGTVSRNVVIACVVVAFGRIRQMSEKEIEETLKKAEQIS